MDTYDLFSLDTGRSSVLREKECIKIFGAKQWEEVKAAGGDGQFIVTKHVDELPPLKAPDLGL